MKVSLRLYKIRNLIRYQWTLLLSAGILLLLVLAVFSYYARFNEEVKAHELLSNEVEMLKNRYETLKYNKSLTMDQIKEYNKLLARLIPESEDFFSIIFALDRISVDTRFFISDYIINMDTSSREKLTILIVGKGDTEAFKEFLEKYQFGGGRLITSDKIEYGGEKTANTKITLNFYSKRFAFNETLRVGQLSKNEIERLAAIKNKISFQFVSSESTGDGEEYTTKKDPFSQ